MSKVFKIIKWLVVVFAVLLLVAQFVRPAKTNPNADQSLAIESQMRVDPKVTTIMTRSCADCHSNKTQWPWYSNVAPVSWFVIDHVNDGRRHLNFSEWGKYDAKRKQDKLGEICKLAKSGEMPLSSYTPLHPGSSLKPEDVNVLCEWANAERTQITSR
jgi:Haem-binding domain